MAEIFEEQVEQSEQEQGPGPKPKMSRKDFAAKIKEKYSDYRDIDDEELVDRIIAKYPDYKESVDFEKKREVGTAPSPSGLGISQFRAPEEARGKGGQPAKLQRPITQDDYVKAAEEAIAKQEEVKKIRETNKDYIQAAENALAPKKYIDYTAPPEVQARERQAVARSLNDALRVDVEQAGSRGGYIWNKFLEGAGSVAAGAMDISYQLDPRQLGQSIFNKLAGVQDDDIVLKGLREEVLPKVREGLQKNIGADVGLGKKARYETEFWTTALGGVAQTIPMIAVPYGGGLLAGSYDMGLQMVENTPEGKKLPESHKSIFAATVGIANAALEKVGLDKIFGKQSMQVANKLAMKTLNDLIEKSSEPITVEAFEKAIGQVINTAKEKAIKVTGRLGEGAAIETVTGGLQEISNITAETALNAIEKKQIFTAEDWATRVKDAALAEGAGGLIFAAIGLPFSRTRNYIAEKALAAQTPEEIVLVKEEILEGLPEDTPQDQLDSVMAIVDQYASVNKKIPPAVQNRREVADAIIERSEIEETIKRKQDELKDIDPAFRTEAEQEIKALEKKLIDLNNKIVVESKKPAPEKFEMDSGILSPGDIIKNKEGQLGRVVEIRGTTLIMADPKDQTRQFTWNKSDVEGQIITGKPVSPEEKKTEVIEDKIVIEEFVGNVGRYKGERGRIYIDGKTVVFKVEGKDKEYEIGNINEVGDKPLSDYGIEQETSVVTVSDAGDIQVRGEGYVNNFSNPLMAINYDKDGNVVSVNLETKDGKKRTFRDNIAEDIAYQIHLKQINADQESRAKFEEFLNSEEAAEQMESVGLPAVTEEGAAKAPKPVQEEEYKGYKIRQFTDRVSGNVGYEIIDTDGESLGEIFESPEAAKKVVDAVEPTKEVVREKIEPVKVEPKPALSSVEETDKALQEDMKGATAIWDKFPKFGLDPFPQGFRGGKISQIVSKAYHKAKADGSNPELVKAVEELLGQKTSPSAQAGSVVGGEVEVFSQTDNKGRTIKYFSSTTEKDGVTKTTFTFNRSDKDSSQRNNALSGVPVETALGDKYTIDETYVPEGAKIIGVSEIRVTENGAAATVMFEVDGQRFQGEVKLKEQSLKETPQAETPKVEAGSVGVGGDKIELSNGVKLIKTEGGANNNIHNYNITDKSGQSLGYIEITDKGDYYQTGNVEIKKTGTGLGTLMYSELAKKSDKPIHSDPSQTDAAKNLWERLVANGVAEKFTETVNVNTDRTKKSFNRERYRTVEQSLKESQTDNIDTGGDVEWGSQFKKDKYGLAEILNENIPLVSDRMRGEYLINPAEKIDIEDLSKAPRRLLTQDNDFVYVKETPIHLVLTEEWTSGSKKGLYDKYGDSSPETIEKYIVPRFKKLADVLELEFVSHELDGKDSVVIFKKPKAVEQSLKETSKEGSVGVLMPEAKAEESQEEKPSEERMYPAEIEGSLRDVELTMRRPDKNEVIFVSADVLLEQHGEDQPSYDIRKKENQIKGRVAKAKDFILNYIRDQRAINPKTGERMNTKVSFEPSVVDIDANGKISFEDGRHRVLAAKELGLTEVPIEVPKGKAAEIEQLLGKPKKESKEAKEVKEGEAVTLKVTDKENKVEGVKIVVPGFEDIDLVAVRDGFNFNIYEVTTGMQVAATSAFDLESAKSQVRDALLSKKVNAEKIFEAIEKGKVKQINESPAFTKYKAIKKDKESKKPFKYSEEEKADFNKLSAQARKKGLESLAKSIDDAANAKEDAKWAMSIEDAKRMLAQSEKQQAIEQIKKENKPLPDKDKRILDDSEQELERIINSEYEKDRYSTIPEEIRKKAYEAYKKMIAIHNKYGYYPKSIIEAFPAVGKTPAPDIALAWYIKAVNAKKVETRPERIKEAIDKLNQSAQKLDEIYGQEIEAKPKEEVPSEAKEEIRNALEDFEEEGKEYGTVEDLVNLAEGLDIDGLKEAVSIFRDEQEDDRKLAGRGDMDTARDSFLDAVRDYLQAEEGVQFDNPAVFKKGDIIVNGYRGNRYEVIEPDKRGMAKLLNLETGLEETWNAHNNPAFRKEKEGEFAPVELDPEEQQLKQEIEAQPELEKVANESAEQVDEMQKNEMNGILAGLGDARRKAGKYIRDGVEYVRNAIDLGVKSQKGGTVRFTEDPTGKGVVVPYRWKIVEAETLQPSHQDGILNPMHFIWEAQPKDRNDENSILSEESFAKEPRFDELNERADAYGGAPVVNERNEVIQGNNRSAGFRKGYSRGTPSFIEGYRNKIIENAEKFGFTKAQVSWVEGMKSPVLVREVAVSDAAALELGNYDVKDLESGGKGRIDPVALSRRIPLDVKGRMAEILFSGEETLNQAIRQNASTIVPILTPYLNQGQKNALTKEGELTQSAIEDIEVLVNHFLFDGGDTKLPQLFENLSHTQKEGLRRSLPYLLKAPIEKSLIPEVQEAIILLNDWESAGGSFDKWLNQTNLWAEGKTPKEIYTPTALKIAEILHNSSTQKEIIGKPEPAKAAEPAKEGKPAKEAKPEKPPTNFALYSTLVADKPATLFDPAMPGISKKDAIKSTFNTDYNESKRQEFIERKRPEDGEQEVPDAEGISPKAKKGGKPKSKGKEAADKLRQAKIDLGKLGGGGAIQMNIAGIPVAIYNKIVEAVARAIEAGYTISEAIAKVVKDFDLNKMPGFDKKTLQKKLKLPVIHKWDKGFPMVSIQTTGAKLLEHPEYKRAKAGSTKSALKVVQDLIKQEKINEILKGNEDAILIPLLAMEEKGNNKIPLAYAQAISKTGGNVIGKIFQTNRTWHTGASAIKRMFAVPKFKGKVTPGKKYIIVDDVVTSGGTVRALREYIESKGGKVVLVTALSASSSPNVGYGGNLALQPETIQKINEKFGKNNFNDIILQYGIANEYTELTNSQAQFLLRFNSIDSIRDAFTREGLRPVRKRNGDRAARIRGLIQPTAPAAAKPSFVEGQIDPQMLRPILEKNKEYFTKIKEGLIGVASVSFGYEADGAFYMDTFDQNGQKAGRYYITANNELNRNKQNAKRLETKQQALIGENTYEFDGNTYTQQELIEFADEAAYYDKMDEAETTEEFEKLRITKIEDAIKFLGEDEVYIGSKSKAEESTWLNYDVEDSEEYRNYTIVKVRDSETGEIGFDVITPAVDEDYGPESMGEIFPDLKTAKKMIDGDIDFDYAKVEKEIEKVKKQSKFEQQIEDLAEKIRSGKINMGRFGIQSNIAGLPIALYNTVLETVATLLEKGASLTEAINKAIKKHKLYDQPGFKRGEFIKTAEDLTEMTYESNIEDIFGELDQTSSLRTINQRADAKGEIRSRYGEENYNKATDVNRKFDIYVESLRKSGIITSIKC